MQAEAVKALLEEQICGAEVSVDGEGCDFQVTIVSDQFQGLMPVKRQQMIYAHLNPFIASGEIHAVTMVTLTPAEQASRQG